jgi:hypothetical protein
MGEEREERGRPKGEAADEKISTGDFPTLLGKMYLE